VSTIRLALAVTLAAAPAWSSPLYEGKDWRSDFVPTAGYRRTVEKLRLQRQAVARRATAAPPQIAALSGTRLIPTILLEYSNRAGRFAVTAYQNVLFDDIGPGFATRPVRRTLTQYYSDMSDGRFLVSGKVVGWYPLPRDDAYYENGDNGAGHPFGELLQLALQRADVDLDFGRFDNDGPDTQPNSGDDDGIVDAVFFIHPESGGECGNDNVWSHSWRYSDSSYGHTGPFVTGEIRKDRDGNPLLAPDGSPQHIVVEDYTIQPGVECEPDQSGQARIVSMGVFAHEFGHALGLPDLYDRTPQNRPDSFGVGNWDLMGGGSWGFSGKRPDLPSRMGAWSLSFLGWGDVQIVAQSGQIDLEPVQRRGRVYSVDVDATDGKEFFLLEALDPTWQDPSGRRVNWSEHVPSPGLAVWHVDNRVGAESVSWPFTPLDQGQNDSPSLPGAPRHSLVSLVQADCQFQLERKLDGGGLGDLYDTGQELREQSTCSTGPMPYDGGRATFAVTHIDLALQKADVVMLADGGTPSSGGGPGGPSRGPAAAPPPPPPPPAAPRARGTARAGAPRTVRTSGVEKLGDAVAPSASGVYTTNEEKISETLSAGELSAVKHATPADIQQTLPPEKQPAARSWLAEERQRVIGESTAATKPAERALVDLRRKSTTDQDIKAQYDPSGTHWQRITGLKLPSERGSRDQAARKKLDELAPIIGTAGANLQQRTAADESEQKRQFQQLYTVDGVSLPIFSKTVSVYYDKEGYLSAVTAQTVKPGELKVAGKPGALSWNDARAVAATQLALPDERAKHLRDGGEGILLVKDDPAAARVARKIELPVGPAQESVVIYVDAATRSVLEIR
jgi:M6 family metalloprotease-like protein